jgi:hypothetical protein
LDCSADSTDVVGYNVYNGDELEYATSTETNYTVTGLTSSTDYTFTVKSKDKANLSDASNDETIQLNLAHQQIYKLQQLHHHQQF